LSYFQVNTVSDTAISKIFKDISIVLWSEDENRNEERQDETEVDRKTVHGDSGNAPSTQKATDLKWKQTLNLKDIEPFCNNFQGPAHNPPVGSIKND
jgi:hypothetical protein